MAIVAGGSGDIGSAVALRLAQLGADVSIAGRTQAKLDQVSARIREATGRKVLASRCDLRQASEPAALVDRTVAEFGRLDIVVTCCRRFQTWRRGFDPPQRLGGRLRADVLRRHQPGVGRVAASQVAPQRPRRHDRRRSWCRAAWGFADRGRHLRGADQLRQGRVAFRHPRWRVCELCGCRLS